MQMNGVLEKAWVSRVMVYPQGAYCFRVIVHKLHYYLLAHANK